LGISNSIKYIFLSFAQAYFEQSRIFPWRYSVQDTAIIIADKMAVDLGVAAKKPCIILSRNGINWSFIVRGQYGKNSVLINKYGIQNLAANSPNSGVFSNEIFTDLLRVSITYNIISKNGIQAENIADMLNTAIIGYKTKLKEAGIHQINGLSIGAEQLIKASSEPELFLIPLSLDCFIQHTVIKETKENNIQIIGDEIEYLENIDFKVINGGTQIQFLKLPESTFSIHYIDAITLNNVIDKNPIPTDDPYIYSISGGVVKGYYKIGENIQNEITIEG